MPRLNDMLTLEQARIVFDDPAVVACNWAAVWAVCLPKKVPFRSRAAAADIEVPEPGDTFWGDLFWTCFLCGKKYDKFAQRGWFDCLTNQHIERRSQCYRPHQHWPENLARVCSVKCHNAMEQMPPAEQLAIKWRHDKCGWSTLPEFLDRWLRVGDQALKAPNRVTVEEVEGYLPKAA